MPKFDDAGTVDREYVYLGDRPLALLQRGHTDDAIAGVRLHGRQPVDRHAVEARLDIEARTLEVRENGELTLSESDMTIEVDPARAEQGARIQGAPP